MLYVEPTMTEQAQIYVTACGHARHPGSPPPLSTRTLQAAAIETKPQTAAETEVILHYSGF